MADVRHDDQEQPEEEGGALTLFHVRTALQDRITAIAREAVDAPARCTHVPAPLIDAARPRDGSACAWCAAGTVHRLLTDPRCSLCRENDAEPGLCQFGAGEFDVLARVCASCLGQPSPDREEPPRA